MKRTVLAVTVIVLVAVAGTLFDWRAEHRRRLLEHPVATGPHVSTAAEIQGGPLTPQRKRTFAALACGGPVTTNDKGEIACAVCPAESDFHVTDAPDAAPVAGEADVPAVPVLGDGWTYGSMLFGHFTVPNADEALLKTNGCESHANNYGGDVLLRKVGGAWTRVRYIQGGLVDEGCQRVVWAGGRDALVCEVGDMHQGVATDTAMLITVEPSAPKQDASGESSWFLSVSSDEGDCADDEPAKATQSASIDRINLLPGTDGRKDVEVLASIGQTQGKAVHDQCPPAVKKPYRLRFRNDGDHFTAVEGLEAVRALAGADCCDVKVSEVVRPYAF